MLKASLPHIPPLNVPHREQTQPSVIAPQRIPLGEFELAWLNCDNACAVVTVRRPT